ncbi:hypothetical protein [Rhizobium leguminosarum]|uniref:hypothetical protein n=1 Tax=Rhizobium leguminosarum TaxID=384 RepID=UPI000374087D|nr:hypothetical protein [Rhizobium leguminosarum]
MSSVTIIAEKPVFHLMITDLESLVEIEAVESDLLELKRALPIANMRLAGKAHSGRRHYFGNNAPK